MLLSDLNKQASEGAGSNGFFRSCAAAGMGRAGPG